MKYFPEANNNGCRLIEVVCRFVSIRFEKTNLPNELYICNSPVLNIRLGMEILI